MGYARRSSPERWAIIYQADVRARLELAVRLLEKLEVRREEDVKKNRHTDFDPSMPWNSVWAALVNNCSEWWKRHVEMPILCVATKAKKVSDYVEGDAPIQASQFTHTPQLVMPTPSTQRQKRKAVQQLTPYVGDSNAGHMNYYSTDSPPAIKGGGKGGSQNKDVWDDRQGRYVMTKNGKPCDGYQCGTCTSTCDGLHCSYDPGSTHQCNRCLRAGHGAQQCWKRQAQAGGGKTGDKGKGGGKGQGGGGKGRGGGGKKMPWNTW